MNDFFRAYLDEEFSRRGTYCEKWDYLTNNFGRDDIIPAFVADMDFPTVPQVKDALVARATHPVYGYTSDIDGGKQAEIGWLKRRYNFDCEPDWILYSPGVIDSLFFCIRCLTDASDTLLVETPVYGPFYSGEKVFGRKTLRSPLKRTETGYEMDFESLEACLKQNVKMMILCSPHNPVGRVWTRDELQKVVELCNRYKTLLVVDEIHADFVLNGHKHTRILSLEDTDNCVMLTSGTKSFNLAGLRNSSIIVKNKELRERIQQEIRFAHAGDANIFGALAQKTAYTYGDEWMDAVCEYIGENRAYVEDYFRKYIPEITFLPQEGTYLMWLDFRALNTPQDEMVKLLVNEAKVGLTDGRAFGEEGDGFFRFNLATQRRNIEAICENIKNMIWSRFH